MGTTEPKRCLTCGYILDHLPAPRCPECRREFDPEDVTTFRAPAVPRPRVWPWLLATISCGVLPIPLTTLVAMWGLPWDSTRDAMVLAMQVVNAVVLVRSVAALVAGHTSRRAGWGLTAFVSLVVLVGCGGTTFVLSPLSHADLPP
jgi:hypothetical protein